MLIKTYKLTICVLITLSGIQSSLACTGGVNNQGSLNPTSAYQIVTTRDGYYYSMNVVCGNVYRFDFCGNGGSSGSLWPEISILNSTGVTQYAFSPYSGGCSTLTWTATFTGTIRILITDSGCYQGQTWQGTMAYNYSTGGALNPAFSLSSLSCTQASAAVTGTPGGLFSFNPAPGGGVTINSSTGAISNGTPGSTYTVQYSVCGNSSTQSVTLQSTNCWIMNGSAQWITVGGQNCIQLTSEVNDQTGCAWDDNILDFSSNFSLSLNYYFGNNINGADGTTFTFQPNPSACGTPGGQIGAGGISNALVIEFDTYDNDNPTHVVDIAADHIAIEVDGNLLNSSHLAGPVAALPSLANIDDGNIHTVNIQWNASTQTLSVFFDGNLRLTTTYNIVANVFGGDPTVRWGATGATGGLNNQQYFCPQTVVILPTEMVSFTAECNSEEEVIRWTTASQDRVDYFEVEYTTNGLLFYPVAQVDGAGTTSQTLNYEVISNVETNNQIYYRIKTVDLDGNIQTSDLISGKSCALNTSLNGYVFENGQLLLDVPSDEVEIELISTSGQLIQKTTEKSIYGLNIAQGIYLLRISYIEEGKMETYRVLHTKN